MRYLIIILFIHIVLIVGAHEIGKTTGYIQGKKDALATNPPNEELELVCAGLWVGEQNKEYVKRNAKK